MINDGNATVFITNMDAAVRFYTETLGLKLDARYGDHWASVKAGSFTIGLHPRSESNPSGTKGSIVVGLHIDEPIEQAAARLREKGIRDIGEIARDQGGNFVHFQDPDGNQLYLWEAPEYGGGSV